MKWFAVSLLFLSFIATGQESEPAWQYNLLENEKWPQPGKNQSPFSFNATIRFTTKNIKSGKTNIETEIAEAVWLKNQSFLADSLKSKFVTYAQLLFDCYEYEARRISGFINAEDTDPELTVRQAIQRAEALNSEIAVYTLQGQDRSKFTEMRFWMDSLLEKTARYDVPQFESTNVSLSIDAGIGVSFYNGPLNKYFREVTGFAFGVKLKVRKIAVDLYQTGGITKSAEMLEVKDFKFEKEDKLEIRQNSLTFGYDVFRKGRFSVSPHASLSSFRVINKTEPKGSLYNRGPASYLIGAGFSASYYTTPFFQDDHLQYSWYFVLRSQFDFINYLYLIDGNSLRFQLGVGIAFNTIKNVLQD